MKQDIQGSESNMIMNKISAGLNFSWNISDKPNLYPENNFWTKALITATPSSEEYFAFFGSSPTVLLMLSALNGIHAFVGQA